MTAELPTKPLDDLLVLDLTRAMAGPIIGRLLVDLGARVVKVEPPDADLTRYVIPQIDGMSAYFAQFNAGKECVSIDLRRPEGRDLLLEMVQYADVLIENYRPGVLDALGVGYDVLSELNPKLIVGSVSGWGSGNVNSGRGAYASAIHAEAGVTELVSRRRDGEPYRNDPMSHADAYTGLHALGALLAALHMRERTGRGQAVDISMMESTLVANDQVATQLTGDDPLAGFKSGQNWSAVYPLRSGIHINLTVDVVANFGFDVIVTAMGRADLTTDERFAEPDQRAAHRAELEAIFGEWLFGFSTIEEVLAAIGNKRIQVGVVRTVTEVAESTWATERGAFVDVDAGGGRTVRVPQTPWRFSDAEAGAVGFVRERGADNAAVLAELAGLAPNEIESLTASGVIGSGDGVR